MAFDYRAELKRPASLALAAIAIMGLLLALGIGLSSSDHYFQGMTGTDEIAFLGEPSMILSE